MLIAEIGSNHFGYMPRARELIRVAKESGADLVKGQAYAAADIKTGSMPPAFYEECALTESQQIELMVFARSIGTTYFCSVFSRGFEKLELLQRYWKVSGAQSRGLLMPKFNPNDPPGTSIPRRDADLPLDVERNIISIPADIPLARIPRYGRARVLHVSAYLADDPQLERIDELARHLGRAVGYSDHTIGVHQATLAFMAHGSLTIEKHFCLEKNVKWGGQVFRDTVHGADPEEFEMLAKAMKG